MRTQNSLYRIAIYAVLITGVLIILFPLYITLITSLKTPQESARSFFALPGTLYLDNFASVVTKAHYFTYFLNSIIVTVVSLTCEMIVVPLFAYAVSRNSNKKYYRIIYLLTIFGIFVPFQAVMLPTIKLLSRTNLLSITGLILMYVTYTFKKGAFLFVGFLQSVPRELEESAYMDGCTITQSYRRIVFPLLQPMIATMIVIDGLWIWNDFLLPLLVLNKNSMQWTLQLFQFQFKNQYSFDFNLAFASFLLSMLPMIILYIFMQRFIISGITRGAVKG
ncbi:MAG: carbohydrate ABC transporter permease [Sphaerochaetaceae bacterium]|nr:carbohydrate ABC transporter permease [Sphaerochaetaceae bacterium]